MPKLLIELSGVEFDRLVTNAKDNRRTPNQQAAHIIGLTLEAIDKPPANGTPDRTDYAKPPASGPTEGY